MSRGGRRTETSLIADPNFLERLIKKIENNKINSINTELMSNRLPIHFGGMSDPFATKESEEVSLEFLKTLKKNNYPTVLSTKNVKALLSDKIIEIIKSHKKLIVQISFTCFSEKYTNLLEPNVPNVLERLNSIKILKELDIPVVIRLQPIFPNLIDDICNYLIPALNEADIDHIILEHLKLPVERNISMIKTLEDNAGWNLYSMYDEVGAKLVGRERLLPNEYKYNNIKKISERLKPGITFSCADYGLQHLGDTKCCCGIDKFWNDVDWFKGNIVNCIKEEKNLEILTIDLLNKYDYPKSSIKRIMNSNSRRVGDNSIKDYLKDKWNAPGTINAPDHLLGVTFIGKDINGNCIYKQVGSKPKKKRKEHRTITENE